MSDIKVRPCAYPTCDNGEGDPRLTMNGICDGCRLRYRRLLDWIVEDYIDLAKRMPKPQAPVGVPIRTPVTSYGHEREWASDALHTIAHNLGQAEASVRESENVSQVTKRRREHVIVRDAHAYITAGTIVNDLDSLFTPRFDALCRSDAAWIVAETLNSHHRRIRALTGRSVRTETVPYPCPRCAVATITRWPGGGKNYMQCDTCGEIIEERLYELHAAIALDDLIASYDTQKIVES